LRTGRKDLAFATLILDAGKAGIAVLIVNAIWGAPFGIFAGAAALIGHCFPLWLGFKGGKGVATYLGYLLAAAWPIGLMACGTWLLTAFIGRISSLSALVAAVIAPVAAFLTGRVELAIASAILTLVIFIRHRANISRIVQGTEPKIGQKHRKTKRF